MHAVMGGTELAGNIHNFKLTFLGLNGRDLNPKRRLCSGKPPLFREVLSIDTKPMSQR